MTKIYAIDFEDNSSIGINVKSLDIKFKQTLSDKNTTPTNTDVIASLELEKSQHEWEANLRKKVFHKILSNEVVELSFSRFILRTLGIIVVSIVPTFTYTLIPLHNVVLYPYYWYETLYIFGMWSIWVAILNIYLSGYYLNIRYIIQYRHLLSLWLSMIITSFLIMVIIYFIWTHALSFQFPMPWMGYIVGYPTYFIVGNARSWFLFPSEWRKNRDFRKRFKFRIGTIVWALLMGLQYELASVVMTKYQNVYQPILSLLFVFIREANAWISGKLIKNTANGDVSGAQHVASSYVTIFYGVVICYILGSSATKETSFVLMGLDFVINIYLSLKLVWLKKQRPVDIEKQIDVILALARNELIECVTPIAFIIAFVVAYYGPNCDLIGNVCAEIWQYTAIKDINGMVITSIMLFIVDFFSTVTSSIILWRYCKTNFLKALIASEKEYGLAFGIMLGTTVFTVGAECSICIDA